MTEERAKPMRINAKDVCIFAIVPGQSKGFHVFLGRNQPTLRLWSEDYPTVIDNDTKKTKKVKAEQYMRVNVLAQHVREQKIRLAGFGTANGYVCFNNADQQPNWVLNLVAAPDPSFLFEEVDI